MKREIKFRGKRYDNRWVYGWITIPNGVPCIIAYGDVCRSEHQVIPSTVGQYTGLKDKDGVEIYEGDIVRWIRKNMYVPGAHFHKQDIVQICEVYYDETQFRFMKSGNFSTGGGFAAPIDFNDDRAEECIVEVIGNIHDNPQLLNK